MILLNEIGFLGYAPSYSALIIFIFILKAGRCVHDTMMMSLLPLGLQSGTTYLWIDDFGSCNDLIVGIC